ncbi:flagellar export protein FliJ [Yoonia sp.]|uniref:flagellar export protein FliJ n=1 Tax=Yoonia sp. TaxID=2212373 RepID=UPI00397644E1
MTDRIRTLAVLEKLRRNDMESEVRELAALRAHIQRLRDNRSNLLNRLRTEARIITLEAAPYVGSYIRSVRGEIAQIDLALSKALPRADVLEAAMAECFCEVKTLSLALERATTQARQDSDRLASAEADELALLRWRPV